MSCESDVLGTTTWDEERLSEGMVAERPVEGGSTGLFGVGVKRCGKAAAPSRVSKGK